MSYKNIHGFSGSGQVRAGSCHVHLEEMPFSVGLLTVSSAWSMGPVSLYFLPFLTPTTPLTVPETKGNLHPVWVCSGRSRASPLSQRSCPEQSSLAGQSGSKPQRHVSGTWSLGTTIAERGPDVLAAHK